MTTKYYKYLYKLMKDDLTDARMELDYAYCAKEDGEPNWQSISERPHQSV